MLDLDIYRSAKLLINRHGDDAVIEAAMMADKKLEAGDLDGLATWKRILKAIEAQDFVAAKLAGVASVQFCKPTWGKYGGASWPTCRLTERASPRSC